MNITSISTYQPEDEQKIRQTFILDNGDVDYSGIEEAIFKNDSSVVSVEDLLSFYIDNKGDLPDLMISSPDDYAALWQDENVENTLQEWRRESGLSKEFIDHVTHFLDLGGAETGTLADAQDFLNSHQIEAAQEMNDIINGGEKYDNVTNLVTNLMTLMMKFGSPGMALLAYVIGFDAVINQEDVDDSVEYTLDEQQLVETDVPGQADYIGVEGKVVAHDVGTEGHTEDVSINGLLNTADEVEGPEVGYVVNSGLGDVVKNLQGTAIDIISDAQSQWDEIIDEMQNMPDDPGEQQVFTQEKQKAISNIQKVIQTMEEFIKSAQDVLNSVVETASQLNQKQAQAWMDIIRNA